MNKYVKDIELCHQAAVENGWWETPAPLPDLLFLIISELGEAIDAYRNGRFTTSKASLSTFYLNFESDFKAQVKDTFEDEVADAYIRTCDVLGGYFPDHYTEAKALHTSGVSKPSSLGSWFLKVSRSVGYAETFAHKPSVTADYLITALAQIEEIASEYNIDLLYHVPAKIQFNKSRGKKHGGKAF